MKRIIAISGLLLMTLGIFSCKNQSWSFPDFDYTTTYFPNQFPVRTLIFGDYIYDNSLDKNMQFLISATTGGVYEQGNNITVGFEVDNSLCDNLINTKTNLPIKAMPAGWYSFDNTSQIAIPSGKFAGGVTVTLTDAFTTDTNSVYAYWAIPLRMTSTTADSMLLGKTGNPAPDGRVSTDWSIMPKDFTIFALRYVNEWHGKYILRGKDVITRASNGAAVETITYHTQYLEGNAIVSLLTSRRNQVKYGNSVRLTGGTKNSFEMKLDFNAGDITQATLSTTTRYPNTVVTGTAKMVEAKDIPTADPQESWGNIPRNTIYLDYQIFDTPSDTSNHAWYGIPLIHTVKDTLVFRDKAVVYDDFTPKVVPAP